MKTYVIILATKYPKSHQCARDETHFVDYIHNFLWNTGIERKIHTVRGNYKLWKKRFIKCAVKPIHRFSVDGM